MACIVCLLVHIQLIELWETYLMHFDADEDNEQGLGQQLGQADESSSKATASEDVPEPPSSSSLDADATSPEPAVAAAATVEQEA